MADVILLGTGAALSEPHRTTTMLAFTDGRSTIVVDCGGDVIQRLLQAGIALESIDALILTHEHADHVSGFPLFMEKIWLSGRSDPLPVYGPSSALVQARRTFGSFDTSDWDGLPEILWNEVALEESTSVLSDDHWIITASPGKHSVPVIGIRIEARQNGGTVTYSGDTEPSDAIARLARNSRILIHEATAAAPGHSTAIQAAGIARKAVVDQLLLVHLPFDLDSIGLREAADVFPWVSPGEEMGTYSF